MLVILSNADFLALISGARVSREELLLRDGQAGQLQIALADLSFAEMRGLIELAEMGPSQDRDTEGGDDGGED